MKLDDIVPVLVMIVYVALLVLKRRKLKGAKAKKQVPPRAVSAPGPRIPGLFSRFGERLKAFFAELEQQFRIEAEKARAKRPETEPRQDIFDLHEPAAESLTGAAPGLPGIARVKHATPRPRIERKREKPCSRAGAICPSRQKIRSAVVWSEILAPPLAIRQEKKPWEN